MAAGDAEDSARSILLALANGGQQDSDCSNLAFVAFNYCGDDFRCWVASELDRIRADSFQTPYQRFLRLSFAVDLREKGFERLIRSSVVKCVEEQTIVRRERKPIVFWHIPKCSGTSLNAAFSAYFYKRPLRDLVPGYAFRPLLQHLATHCIEWIPYLPSSHLGVEELRLGNDAFTFTCFRDPLRRALSMYRQEMANHARSDHRSVAWHHYRHLGRYGSFWDYRRDTSFSAWLENVPSLSLERQLTTFSRSGCIEAASRQLKLLNYWFTRDVQFGSEEELFELLEIPYTRAAVPARLNESDKQIRVDPGDEDWLRSRLQREYELLYIAAPGKFISM